MPRKTCFAILVCFIASFMFETVSAAEKAAEAQVYIDLIRHLTGTNKPGNSAVEIHDTAELSELGNPGLPPAWGPLQQEGTEALCPGQEYFYWFPNPSAAPLLIDFVVLQDPYSFPGGPFIFAQNWVVPPRSTLYGLVTVGFCATTIGLQYNYNNSANRTNQSFLHNAGWYSFQWRWLENQGALASQETVGSAGLLYYNTSGLFAGPYKSNDIPACLSPWVNNECADPADGVVTILGPVVIPQHVSAVGTTGLVILILFFATAAYLFKRRQPSTAC